MTTKKTIKRLILTLGCASLTLASLSAQTAELRPSRAFLTQLQEDFASRNYIGYQHDLPRLRALPLLAEHLPYRRAIVELMAGQKSPDEVLTRFLKEYPRALERPSAELLLALVYVDQGLLPLARTQLEKVETSALSPREAAQRDLALAYVLLSDQRGAVDLEEAQRLLVLASEDSSIVGEQALLYLGSVAWARGDIQEARTIFSRTDYSPELAPEAAYQLTLLSFSTEDATTAQRRASELQRTYPEMASRASLKSVIGQSYYAAGDYQQAIQTLQPLQELDDYRPTAEECYALGTSLYTLGRYEEALRPLSTASESSEALGAQALFLLGNACAPSASLLSEAVLRGRRASS